MDLMVIAAQRTNLAHPCPDEAARLATCDSRRSKQPHQPAASPNHTAQVLTHCGITQNRTKPCGSVRFIQVTPMGSELSSYLGRITPIVFRATQNPAHRWLSRSRLGAVFQSETGEAADQPLRDAALAVGNRQLATASHYMPLEAGGGWESLARTTVDEFS